MTVLFAALALALLGLILGGLIGFTAKKFAVETDPRIEEITNLLPGANCGGCGYAGCADYARAIVEATENELYPRADLRTRLRLKYVECLVE